MGLASVVFVLIVIFTASSFQQQAGMRCEPQSSYNRGLFISSYSSYGLGVRCAFDNIKSLDDFDQAKKSTPRQFTQISSIIFMNSSLSKLPDKMFESFTNVRTLDASRLVLSEISKNAFFNSKSWDSINLSNNQLTKLEERTFATMQIMNLDLSMNRLEAIDDSTFQSANIQRLSLAFNKLKTMQFLNSFAFFKTMELNDNQIQSFKIDVKKDVWSNRPRLFEDLFNPKIHLQNNKFKTFDCISNVKLGSLTLENNPALTEIALNQCELDEIDVSNCESLKKVSFNDNLLGLTAKNVKLSDVDVSRAKSLTTLSMANSSVAQSVVEDIMKMENLTFLDLSFVNIGPLNISTFSKLKSLQFLLLKSTNISNISFGTFSHQQSVKEFDISDNHLGFFDMNMIFSMSSLLSLDLSGNDLTSIENIESAHFTFTLMQKIDLSNNKWPCSYLMRLIKIFRLYKVAMVHSRENVEEVNTNIAGIHCIHVEGDDDVIEPLSPDNSNMTQVKEKLNELVLEVAKNAQFKGNFEARLKQMETRIDNQMNSAAVSAAAFGSEKSQSIEVRNSSLLEFALLVVCFCFTAFMVMQIFVFIKRNFLGQPQRMRSSSERNLSMTVDDF